MPPDYSPFTHLPNNETPPPEPARRSVWPKILLTIIVFLLIAAGGGLGYAYWKKLGPFSQPPYDPEHLLAGITKSFSDIQSANYSLSLEIKPVPREANSQPLLVPNKLPFDQNTLSRFIPADFQLRAEVTSAFDRHRTDWQTSDARSQLKGNLTGGDFNFSIDLEWIKKGLDFYFRLNKFPTLFFFDLSAVKGTWIKVAPEDLAADDWRISFLKSAPDLTEEIKTQEEKLARDLERALRIADEEKVITAKVNRRKEKIDNFTTYRYDLTLNRTGLIKFYERLLNEIETLDLDRAILEYLKSQEFEQIAEYLEKNNRFSLWVEEDSGWPLQATYYLRLIPSAEVKQFKDKQINLSWNLNLTDINQPITVNAPADFKTIKKVMEELFPNS